MVLAAKLAAAAASNVNTTSGPTAKGGGGGLTRLPANVPRGSKLIVNESPRLKLGRKSSSSRLKSLGPSALVSVISVMGVRMSPPKIDCGEALIVDVRRVEFPKKTKLLSELSFTKGLPNAKPLAGVLPIGEMFTEYPKELNWSLESLSISKSMNASLLVVGPLVGTPICTGWRLKIRSASAFGAGMKIKAKQNKASNRKDINLIPCNKSTG